MATRTHYQTFEITPTATADEIKRRYRELARKYHPDVNVSDPGAAGKFAAIADAYRVLGDAAARATYDAELLMQARAARPTSPPQAQTQRGANAGGGPRPQPQNVQAAHIESEKYAELARKCYFQGRFIEAKEHAIRSLSYNHRNAMSQEIMGDVYMQQGRLDDAAKHYTFCLQFDQFNGSARMKLERLHRTTSRSAHVHASRGGSGGGHNGAFLSRKQQKLQALIKLVGYSAAIMMIGFWFIIDPRYPSVGLEFVKSWSIQFILFAIAIGGWLGMIQSVTGDVRRFEEEFLFGAGQAASGGFPAGPALLVLGIVFYPLGMLSHIGITLVQDGFHRSVGLLYGTVTAATIMLAVFCSGQHGFGETLAFGGNLLFLGHVAGRISGDFFRGD
jgi:curved DNA-binding protein CbpA